MQSMTLLAMLFSGIAFGMSVTNTAYGIFLRSESKKECENAKNSTNNSSNR